MEEELLKNIDEFLYSGNDNLEKRRYNAAVSAAVSDFFKAVVVSYDFLLYKNTKIIPKNHNDRFSLLRKYFSGIYEKVSELFKLYTRSYNLRLEKKDAIKLRNYANELRNKINKE